MSSAANDKRGKLEGEFRSRLHDAEASPSQDLWARIDHDLTVQENGEYKKRAAFYRQLAAACIALLLLAGGVGAYYFGGTAANEQQLATTAPAHSPNPAVASSAPTDNAGVADAVASTTKPPAQEMSGAFASKAKDAGAEQRHVVPAGRAAASGTGAAREDGAAPVQAGAEDSPATGALAIEGVYMPEPAAAVEKPLNLSRPLRQTIAALSATEEKTPGSPNSLSQGSPATSTAHKAADDFRTLNEQVMAQARQQEEEKQARLLALNEEVTKKKELRNEKREGDSRWSLGMAYAPSYFDQNIGISQQAMMGSTSRYSSMPNNSADASISSLYMNAAREEYAENTDPGFSFGFEAKAGLRLSKKLKLLTGLGYLQNTARSKSSYIIQQFRSNGYINGFDSGGPSTIFIPSLSSNGGTDSLFVARTPEYKVNHRYRYLTVPVGLQYEGSIGKDWFWYGGTGVAANILMQTTILASSSEVKDVEYDLHEDSPFRRLLWSGNVSGGVGKRLAGNMSVTVGPEFRGYFNTLLAEPENAQAPQGRPYALGLNMAVNYELHTGKKGR